MASKIQSSQATGDRLPRRDLVAALIAMVAAPEWDQAAVPTVEGVPVRCVESIGSADSPGELRSLAASRDSVDLVVAAGFWTPGDGGGGAFLWTADAEDDDGGTIIVPTLGGGSWRRIAVGTVSVAWFGTGAPDGGPDDVAAQRALDFAAGRTVVFPTGTYHLTNPLLVRPNTRVVGDRSAVVIQTSWSQPVFKLIGVSGVTIAGLTLRGQRGSTDSNHAGVYLDDCRNCRVRQCVMSELDLGIHVASNLNESTACEFSENTISDTADNGIGITAHLDHPSGLPQAHHLVTKNVVSRCGEATGWGKGIELRACRSCIVSQNVVTDNFFGGIQLEQGCDGVLVEGNMIARNGQQGIVLLTSGAVNVNNTIAHNTIRENAAQGIHFNGSGCNNTLRGNAVLDNGDIGIHVTGTDRASVQGNRIAGNRIQNNRGRGIDLPNAWRTAISGNHITGNAGVGIALRGEGRENIVCGNVISSDGAGYAAIEVADSQSRNVLEGNVCTHAAGSGPPSGIVIAATALANIVSHNHVGPPPD